MLSGEWRAAASAWEGIGMPYEQALALLEGPEGALREALAILDGLGAGPLAAIVRRRRRSRFARTRELAEFVAGVIPRQRWPRRIDPATRTFQALRMEVNDEMESLREGLEVIVSHLKPGGRIGVVAFHSLEDKAVKDFLNVEAKDCICPPHQPVCTCNHRASVILPSPHPQRPGKDEIEANPRSRSARLRGAIKLQPDSGQHRKK